MRFHSTRHAYGCCSPCSCGASQDYGRPPVDFRGYGKVALVLGVIALIAVANPSPSKVRA